MCSDEEIHGVRALTTEILAVLASFASEFSRPTWKNIQVLLIGAILCRGPRRVSSVLRVMGLASIRNFSKYHRVLSRAEWEWVLFSFITLVAFNIHQTKALVSMETASWYDKKGELTFSDIIAIVRRSIWSNKYFSKSENQLDLDKRSEEKINSLIYQLTLAA